MSEEKESFSDKVSAIGYMLLILCLGIGYIISEYNKGKVPVKVEEAKK